MSIALAQWKSYANVLVYSVGVTFDSTPTAGRLIVVQIHWFTSGGTISGVADGAGNTYVAAGAPVVGADGRSSQIWYAYNVAVVASHTVTATQTGTGWLYVHASEWSGLSGTNDPLDGYTGATYASLTTPFDFSGGTLTPTASGHLMIVGVAFGAGLALDTTPPSSTTAGNNGAYWQSFFRVLPSTAAYAATMSLDGDSTIHTAMALFKADSRPWVDWADFEVRDVDFGLFTSGAARVSCALHAAASSLTLQARLYDLTNLAALAESAAVVNATTETDATFPVTSSGVRRCKLQITANVSSIGLWCAPGATVLR
jgi:hypothetical protein